MLILRYLGYLLLFNGAWMLIQRATARGRAIGTVVGHDKDIPASSSETSVSTSTRYHAVIEFADAQNRPHRFTLPGSDTAPNPRRGTRVNVRYRHGNPDDAYIPTFAQMWIMPIAWLAAGALALFCSRS